MTEGEKLVRMGGVRLRVTRVWQSGPLLPGGQARLGVEAEAPVKAELWGPFLLKLNEADGARTFTVRGVRFP